MTGREVTRERRRVVRLGDTELDARRRRARPAASRCISSMPRATRGPARVLVSAWKPGDPVWSGSVDGRAVAVQVRPVPNGFLLAHRGVEATAYVYTEREAQAARLMPVKKVAGHRQVLLCPMPGLVVSIAVAEGQEVKAGETLAVVEAMKMENVLRAERDGDVKAIHVKPGDSLAVDAVIMEFA